MRASRPLAALVAASLLLGPVASLPARADNPMGYRLLTAEEASSLPRNKGSLGMNVERAQRVTDNGMTFDLMKVVRVRSGTPAERAGFKFDDTIIAVDGRVFPTIAAFASYLGSTSPGGRVQIDYIPKGGGPQQAQRVDVVMDGPGAPPATQQPPPTTAQQAPAEKGGMSTMGKIAIGAAAAAVIGCYWKGCFSKGQQQPAR